MSKRPAPDSFHDPFLDTTEESEIAAVDVSTFGEDEVFRPVYINQDEEILALTPEDAKRLLGFLRRAVRFLDAYQRRKLQ